MGQVEAVGILAHTCGVLSSLLLLSVLLRKSQKLVFLLGGQSFDGQWRNAL